MRQPLVDVCLPTYGPVPYLAEALEGMVAQSYEHWRLTLVDNSPETGGAAAVLEPYLTDPRVRYLATGGLDQAHNWTTAMRSGDAPYVAMLHDDDIWEPGFLERRVAFLEAHPECGLVFSNYREIGADSKEIAPRAPRLAPGVHQPLDFVPREYLDNVIPVATVLYRRSAFDAAGGDFDPRIKFPDYELWLRMAVQRPVGFLDVRDCRLRIHPASVTSTMRSYGQAWLDFVERADEIIARDLPAALPPLRFRRRRRSAALLTCALDAYQEGRMSDAAGFLRRALRTYPRSLLDPRVPALLMLLASGGRGRRALERTRVLQRRYHLQVHRFDLRMLLDDLMVRAGLR